MTWHPLPERLYPANAPRTGRQAVWQRLRKCGSRRDKKALQPRNWGMCSKGLVGKQLRNPRGSHHPRPVGRSGTVSSHKPGVGSRTPWSARCLGPARGRGRIVKNGHLQPMESLLTGRFRWSVFYQTAARVSRMTPIELVGGVHLGAAGSLFARRPTGCSGTPGGVNGYGAYGTSCRGYLRGKKP